MINSVPCKAEAQREQGSAFTVLCWRQVCKSVRFALSCLLISISAAAPTQTLPKAFNKIIYMLNCLARADPWDETTLGLRRGRHEWNNLGQMLTESNLDCSLLWSILSWKAFEQCFAFVSHTQRYNLITV